MTIITYDCEVFKHDWIVVLKDKQTKNYTVIHNDNEALKMAINNDEYVYVGFNSKNYDQYIIKAICLGLEPEQIKEINDYIIAGNQGFTHPYLKGYFTFNNVDIKDDMQAGLSLKAIEGHLKLPIVETNVDFNIDRALTQEELELTIKYCKYDVDSTEKIIDLRKDYLQNKINIGKLAKLDEIKALQQTNAKLTAAILKATQKEYTDERNYTYPTNLLKKYIDPKVFEFFDRLKDKSISDDEVFSSKVELTLGDCEITLGYGGIHGAISNCFIEENKVNTILNVDVASYYPNLMTNYNYVSRNIESSDIFKGILKTRLEAKKKGDKTTANALKLVVNTTYGAMLNKYNPLYDPLMGRSVCITGQLFLLELATHLFYEVENLILIQLNTDGIMFSYPKLQEKKVLDILKEWEKRTNFELELGIVKQLVQKDVNNYLIKQADGSIKSKGGYLVKGISTAGAFNINNNCVIVADALIEYFTNKTPIEQTINSCNDIFKFQIIAKAGSKYESAYQLVNDEKVFVQKINRVYASKDKKYGKIYKIKQEDGSVAKIENLPEYCIIDNENKLTIEDIDKSYYIEKALKQINDFKGEKTMATKKEETKQKEKTKQNVYQKLIQARLDFLNSNPQKTGKNMHLAFKYFELDDIVPLATKIFNDIGLISLVNFTDTVATIRIVDTDTSEFIELTAPFNQIKPIVSNTGKNATNEMQALGSSITYMRRYLYMLALDICEEDSIDANLGKPEIANKKFISEENRTVIKEMLIEKNNQASQIQITGLKTAMKKLLETDPTQKEYIKKIVEETNNLKSITKDDCAKILNEINNLMQ